MIGVVFGTGILGLGGVSIETRRGDLKQGETLRVVKSTNRTQLFKRQCWLKPVAKPALQRFQCVLEAVWEVFVSI